MTNLHVGQNFSTFSEFEQYLSRYENENFVKFSKRDSRKIETAVRSGETKVELNPELIYYDIKYNCVRGDAFHAQGSGTRKTSSCKTECSAHILLRAAADGKSLEVKSFDDTHNHEISKVIKKSHPNDAIPESQENRSQNFQEVILNEENVINDSTAEITWNSAANTALSDIDVPQNCQKENADGIDNENICPQPQTPKMSGSNVPSTNNSTKRGQKFSLRKRKCDEIEDIEVKAIKTQSDMAAELKKVAQSAEDFEETTSALLQTLVNVRNSVVNMSQKMDLIVNLLRPSSSNV